MLGFNPYLAERLAEERRKDAMREAEQARLIRAAKGATMKRSTWRLLSAIGIDRRKSIPGRWAYPERRLWKGMGLSEQA